MKEEEIIKLFKETDFDHSGKSQAKVSAKINRSERKSFRLVFAATALSAIIAAFVFWPNQKQSPMPAVTQNLSEAECLDLNTRYWLEKVSHQEEIITARCPDNMQVSAHDKNFIVEIQHRMQNNFNKLSDQEKEKLEDCGEKFKYKVRPVMFYRAEC